MFVAAPVVESPPAGMEQVQPAPVVEYVTPASAVTYALPLPLSSTRLLHPPFLTLLQLPQEQRRQQSSQLRQCRSPRCQSRSVVAVHRQGRRLPCRGAEADPYGPDVSEDDRDSTVIVHRQGGRCPRRPGCARSTGAGYAEDNRDPAVCRSWRTSLRCLKSRLFRAARPPRVWALHLSAMWHRPRLWRLSRSERLCLLNPRHP